MLRDFSGADAKVGRELAPCLDDEVGLLFLGQGFSVAGNQVTQHGGFFGAEALVRVDAVGCFVLTCFADGE